MDIRKFVIGLIVGVFVAAGVWYALKTPVISEMPSEDRRNSAPAPLTVPGSTSGYGPKTPPSVTPPTTPPPSY